MASVPKSQYDDLQKRHENMRSNREREQRRCSKLEKEIESLRHRLHEVSLDWQKTQQQLADTTKRWRDCESENRKFAAENTILVSKLVDVTKELDEYLAEPHGKCCEWRVASVETELAALQAKYDELVKDAKRYRWLRQGRKDGVWCTATGSNQPQKLLVVD